MNTPAIKWSASHRYLWQDHPGRPVVVDENVMLVDNATNSKCNCNDVAASARGTLRQLHGQPVVKLHVRSRAGWQWTDTNFRNTYSHTEG